MKMVGSAGNAPVRLFRHIFYDARFTVEQPDHFPAENSKSEIRTSSLFRISSFGFRILNGSGSGSRTHLNEFIPDSSGCALVEFPAIKWWSRWVPPPYELACRASALLV